MIDRGKIHHPAPPRCTNLIFQLEKYGHHPTKPLGVTIAPVTMDIDGKLLSSHVLPLTALNTPNANDFHDLEMSSEPIQDNDSELSDDELIITSPRAYAYNLTRKSWGKGLLHSSCICY